MDADSEIKMGAVNSPVPALALPPGCLGSSSSYDFGPRQRLRSLAPLDRASRRQATHSIHCSMEGRPSGLRTRGDCRR